MKEIMKRYLQDIIECKNGVDYTNYEPPNNIPIMRYKVMKENYKIAIIGNDANIISCIRWLYMEKLNISYIVTKDYKIVGYKTIDFNELKKKARQEKIFVIITDAIFSEVVAREKIIYQLNKIGIEDYIYPYEYEKMPKHSMEFVEYLHNNIDKIKNVIDMLEDNESIKTYCEYIRAIENIDFYRLYQIETWLKYFDKRIYKHLDDECFVNLGSSNGDSLFYFLENFEQFEKIYVFDSDKDRMRRLKINKQILSKEVQEKVFEYNISVGIDNSDNNLDNILYGKKVTLISMDIEGAELNALKGAKNIIKEQEPVLAICAYHLASDLVDLPYYIKSLSPNYHFYYRKYASTFRNKFRTAELVMYAVPTNRLVIKEDTK